MYIYTYTNYNMRQNTPTYYQNPSQNMAHIPCQFIHLKVLVPRKDALAASGAPAEVSPEVLPKSGSLPGIASKSKH